MIVLSCIRRRKGGFDAETEELADGDPGHGSAGSALRDPVVARQHLHGEDEAEEPSSPSQASAWSRASTGIEEEEVVRGPMKAWVVTWETGPHRKAPSPHVVAVLPSRLHIRRIEEFLSHLYINLRGSPEERVEYVRSGRVPLAFQPQTTGPMDPRFNVPRSSQVWVGHPPMLFARVVQDLKPSHNSFTWNEAPRPTPQTRIRQRRGSRGPRQSRNEVN